MSETTETTEKPIESNPSFLAVANSCVEGNEKGEGKTLPNLSKISTFFLGSSQFMYWSILS